MTTNNWFLGACVVFAVAALVAIIAGIATHHVVAIVAGAVVLVVAAALFISGLNDRKHLTPRQRAT